MGKVNPTLTARARRLRAEPTDSERALWRILRSRAVGGWRFRRQHPIGLYIADFACPKARLIVEADGGQHADSAHDEERTRFLQARGWRVVRFWNTDILTNLEGVREVVAAALGTSSEAVSQGVV